MPATEQHKAAAKAYADAARELEKLDKAYAEFRDKIAKNPWTVILGEVFDLSPDLVAKMWEVKDAKRALVVEKVRQTEEKLHACRAS